MNRIAQLHEISMKNNTKAMSVMQIVLKRITLDQQSVIKEKIVKYFHFLRLVRFDSATALGKTVVY